MLRVGAVAVAGLLAGCQSQTVKLESAFDPKAAELIRKDGEGRIDGHAFIKRFNGKVTHAAGDAVYLIPATAYAKERFDRLYAGRKFKPATNFTKVADDDPRFAEFMRRTKAESSGRFSFDKVAPGSYFIATTVTWQDTPDSHFARGGAIYETVTLTGKEDKPVKVIVNGF